MLAIKITFVNVSIENIYDFFAIYLLMKENNWFLRFSILNPNLSVLFFTNTAWFPFMGINRTMTSQHLNNWGKSNLAQDKQDLWWLIDSDLSFFPFTHDTLKLDYFYERSSIFLVSAKKKKSIESEIITHFPSLIFLTAVKLSENV